MFFVIKEYAETGSFFLGEVINWRNAISYSIAL